MGEREELRVQCRLAWNGWPDSEQARGIIAAHEAKDTHSRDAWDRVITAIESCGRAQSPWRPIETAPKDGTPIEVCNTRHASHAPVIVRWTDDGLPEDLPEPHWCDAATADGSALYFNDRYFDFWKPITPLRAPEAADAGAAAWQYRYKLGDVWSDWVDLKKDQFDRLSENVSVPYESRVLYTSSLERALAEIERLRILSATDFKSPNCQGQRGQDRCDALYDAYQAVKALSVPSTDGETGGQRS